MSFTRQKDDSELLAMGFVKDENGNYYKPDSPGKAKTIKAQEATASNLRVRDSRPVPTSEQGDKDARGGLLKTGKERKKQGRKSVSRENETGKRWRIRVTNYRVANFDSDNIYAKWYIDELKKQGIIPDDGLKYVDCTTKWAVPVSTPEEERTLVEVYEYDYP